MTDEYTLDELRRQQDAAELEAMFEDDNETLHQIAQEHYVRAITRKALANERSNKTKD